MRSAPAALPRALNRKIFFDHVRPLFGGRMTASQVAGLTVDLDIWEEHFRASTPFTQLAVCLATEFHETAQTMQPIRERGGDEYLRLNYDVTGRNPERARRYGNVRPGDGVRYCGRSKVQLTWYVNYLKATVRLHELGLIGPDVDFTKDPAKVMEPRVAAMIMFLGMEEGWFTGKTLDQLVDPDIDGDEHADAVKSRAIINGSDRAELIAGYSDHFLAALVAASSVAAPPLVPEPDPLPEPPTPKAPSLWSRLTSLFR